MIEVHVDYNGTIPLSNGKLIQQFNENHVLMHEFSSFCDVVLKTGITQTRICRGCRDNVIVNGFYWKAIEFKIDKKWWFDKLSLEYKEKYCEHCGKKIDENFIINVNRKEKIIRLRSSFGKIVCSKKCGQIISNIECHKNDPERGKRFNKLMSDRLKEKGFDEFYHEPDKIRQQRSIQNSKDNPKWHSSHSKEKREEMSKNSAQTIIKRCRGKTFDEIYGTEKANEIKQKISNNTSGENNPMFGKPSPFYSGGGFIGIYNNLHFRSIIELSFIKEMMDYGIIVESAENQKFKVEYFDINGQKRNYFPDFYLPENDTVVELKHTRSLKDKNVEIKSQEAKKNFKNFILLTNNDINMINYTELNKMVENKEVELCERSFKKLQKLMNYVS